MSEKTRNLSYDDIKFLRKNLSGKSKKIIQQKQNENQKEIE